jgi:hypothetical protein
LLVNVDTQHIVNKEGVPTDELDVKGLDLMKSNFPPLFKKFGEHIINEIMFGKSKNDIDKQILNFRNEIRTIGWKHILKPTGLKKMGEYLAGPPSAGEIFSKIKLKCPINTKAAIYTNDILRFKKLDKKYPTFQIGDKIYLVYLKDNPYRIDAIALNGYNDAPELLEFAEKYIDRDGLFDSVMKNKLEDSTIAISNTTQLNKLIGITNGYLDLKYEKINKFITKLIIADNQFTLNYALADTMIIPKAGEVTGEMSWNIEAPY